MAPPNISVSKINVTVHWRSQIQGGDFGIIIRDSSGLVSATLCDTSFELGGELQLFAFAIQKALWLAKELDCRNLIVEGDCDDLLDSLRTPPLPHARRKAKATVENKVNTNVRSPKILAFSLLGANDEHEHVYYLDSCTGAIDC
ncbi:hypothetical protein FCV25MIE_03033 [Fagus crenata]